jgi:hypothetical protein
LKARRLEAACANATNCVDAESNGPSGSHAPATGARRRLSFSPMQFLVSGDLSNYAVACASYPAF